ncbi:FG-GAP repeat domain-containing protein [Marinomonas ostreistagni]|uniref:FG-GAP repeat domain-containing protein n=1 Tax=Marinomonas ostreistagni TaxID=359209 RepID=UPI001951A2EC|nr:VCBS repeat-containing protein [Marinomonas ostreistagni]MBM6550842.1 VCBS repeat-containing protein [Marinomonas ostreistagni]
MASSTLSFQSNYDYQRQQTTTRHAVSLSREAAPERDAEGPSVSLSAQMGRRLVQQQEINVRSASSELEPSGKEAAEHSISQVEQRFQRMISVLERMFGIKVQLYEAPDANAAAGAGFVPPEETADSANEPNNSNSRQTVMAMREYHQVIETESSQVAIQGKLELSDGRKLNVDFRMDMARSRQEEYWGELTISSQRQVDPLVVNLNNNGAQLTQRRMDFDLDGDGETERVAFATGDSAFLARDRNNNGTIDDGSELFGPQSGSGFADLAEHDSNGDGLIDQLDDIWQELVLVQRDEAGNESLLSLADVGIDAFVLERTYTPFGLFNAHGERMGNIRETGLYVRENGTVDSLQHVDLTI